MRLGIRLLVALLGIFGMVSAGATTAAQEGLETVEKLAVVYSCETVDCTDADGVKDPMQGATVTSFDAAGAEVDSCTTNEYGQCGLLVPAAEDGTYAVTPGPGFEAYTLVSAVPESTGEGGDGREWTFVPPASGEPVIEKYPVNVVACSDTSCDDAVTMDGAVLVSYQDGTEIDRCTVSSAADDFDGCQLALDPDNLNVVIAPAAGFEDHSLLSDEPEIYETEQHGRIHLWTYVLDEEEAPATDGETDGDEGESDEDEQVSGLPRTGTGTVDAGQGEPAMPGLALAAVVATTGLGVRLRGRQR